MSSAPTGLPSAGYRRYALGTLLTVYVFNFIDRSILSILAQSIKEDLDLSDTEHGFLGGIAFAVFYTFVGIPIARVADRGVVEFTEFRILGALAAGQNVGPETSLLKTRGTELQQAITELALEATGYYANPFDASTPERGDNFQPVGPEYANGVAQGYFNTRKVSIFAGSNEIQRNIMSKLVLGL